jgi:hypothetical protein
LPDSKIQAPRLENVTTNYAGAIYGAIVAMSVIVTTSYDTNLGSGRVAFWSVITTGVFWLAHVYMRVVDAGFARPRKSFGVARRAMKFEWPMVQAALFPAAVLVLGAMDVFNDDLAIDLSLWTGVAVLFGAGVLVGKRDDMATSKCILIGVINAMIGLLIVGMKIFIH